MNESNYTMYEPAPTYYPSNAKPPLNPLAVVSLITGLFGGAVVPVVLGHISLARINQTGERGRSAAIIGLVLGYLQVVVFVIAFWTGLFDL